jgi:tRNA A-37 threonylcarbamoyl transferase component Bud32
MANQDEPRDTSPVPEPAPTTLDPTTIDPTRMISQNGLIGETINSRYVIQKELKRGGMGVVYLARDQQLHSRPVVIKVLLDDAYQSEYVVQKFRQEVEALSRVDHPGIVGIIDSGEMPNGRPFIAMQYVEGATLRSLITPEGMNLERGAEIIKQIGRALSAAHKRGILHRDLKPENIMLQDLGHGEEQVKIIDFGIAKVKSSVIAPSTSLNLSPGTVAYMAPEQLNGRPITAATDIYAMGAIVYEMFTGRKPFNPETGFELLQMQQSGVRIKPSDLRPSLPLEAQEMILKALNFNPADRYDEPREFGDNLARALTQGSMQISSENNAAVAPPPTQLPDEETPFAQPAGARPPKTIQVPFQPATPVNLSATQLGLAGRSHGGRGSGSKGIVMVAIAGVLIAVVAFGGWYFLSGRGGTVATPETPAPAVTERNLSYKLAVQKMRNGRPYQEEFESSGQEIFENGWKFRMNVNSPQTGYLYLLNEGPAEGGEITYNMLFPAPSMNSGSPYLAASQKIETAWMVFDENQGTEKFWMIWAAEAVPELEAVKGVVNPTDKGEIKDSGQSKAVREFLKKHESSPAEKDKNKKQTNVKAKGNVLVHHLELEHH